ncbi:hypothetical protein PYW08_006520 [Mythimna loreyi]|uniref:Uncharacterized protein n=1 Tax=Mythimna loreyi TaxID=667449 RepID=A0ACC2QNF0_9NEOP|nr:hypothetical protein PYW08_006520 [Mythimna loreyi]
MWRVVGLFVFVSLALAKNEVYDGYGLYKVSVKSADQTELVNHLSHSLDLDVWVHALPGHDGQVLVPKEKKELFQNELKAAGVEFIIETDNIKE